MNNQQLDTTQTSTIRRHSSNKPWHIHHTGIAHNCKKEWRSFHTSKWHIEFSVCLCGQNIHTCEKHFNNQTEDTKTQKQIKLT